MTEKYVVFSREEYNFLGETDYMESSWRKFQNDLWYAKKKSLILL